MFIYNFSSQNGALRIQLVSDQSERFLFYPSLERINDKLNIKEAGTLSRSFLFTEVGTVAGVTPTDLNNAGDLITDLIESIKVSANPSLTDAQLRASAIQVTLSNPEDLKRDFDYSATNYSTLVANYPSVLKNKIAYVYQSQGVKYINEKVAGHYIFDGTTWQPYKYPVSVDEILKVDTQLTQPLTDAQLRATPVQVTESNPITGFAMQTTLAEIKAKTDNLDVLLSSITKPTDTQPISATALPLPTGASTLAEQQIQTTLLRNFNTVIEEIQQTGFYIGKIAKAFMILGRRISFSSNTLFNDIGEAIGVGALANFPILTGAETLQLISTNAADSSAGTGVRTVKVTYINTSNNLVQSASITLNGTTAVNCGFNANAVLWIESQTVGSNGAAVGNITLRTSAPLSLIQITANGNKSMDSFFMVPIGYTAYLTAWNGSCIANEQDLRIRATVNTLDRSVTPNVYHFQDNKYLPANTSDEVILPWLKLPELAKVKCSTISASTAGATRIESGFTVILIQN
jgi:hypothetical protein